MIDTKRLTLRGLAESKAQRFQDEMARGRTKSNLSADWLYYRMKKLLLPGNYIACETCGMATTFEGVTIDHKVPRSQYKDYKGNVHNTENLELICGSCNSMKNLRTLPEFLEELHQRNEAIMKMQRTCKEIIAPVYPNVGLGQKIFGEDKSFKKIKQEQPRKNKKSKNKNKSSIQNSATIRT